jgi:hypothetical protein
MNWDNEIARRSIGLLAALDFEIACPGHGDPVERSTIIMSSVSIHPAEKFEMMTTAPVERRVVKQAIPAIIMRIPILSVPSARAPLPRWE